MPINKVPELWCWSCEDSGLIETWDETGNMFRGYAHCTSCPPIVERGRFTKLEGHWGTLSTEIWIDRPCDKTKTRITEPPF